MESLKTLIGTAQVFVSVGIGAVLTEFAVSIRFEVLASLGLEVVVGDIEHSHLNFEGQGLKLSLKQLLTSSFRLSSCNP